MAWNWRINMYNILWCLTGRLVSWKPAQCRSWCLCVPVERLYQSGVLKDIAVINFRAADLSASSHCVSILSTGDKVVWFVCRWRLCDFSLLEWESEFWVLSSIFQTFKAILHLSVAFLLRTVIGKVHSRVESWTQHLESVSSWLTPNVLALNVIDFFIRIKNLRINATWGEKIIADCI